MATATKIPLQPEVLSKPPALTREFHQRLNSISRQSLVYFAGTMLTTAAGYFFKIYLARTLGAEKLGLYALGMTLVGFVGLFNTLGLPTAAARFVSSYFARKDFVRLGIFLRTSIAFLASGNLILAAGFVLVGPWMVIHLYHVPNLAPLIWPFALIMFFGVLNTFLGQVMAGYQDVTRRTLITHFLGSPANILLAVMLISAGFGLGGYLAAQVASAFLVTALLATSVWKMTPQVARKPGPWHMEREVVAFSSAAFAVTGVEFVLAQADKIVLGVYLDVREVGIYAVAMALVGFVPVVLQSVNQIFSPAISELYASEHKFLLQRLYSTLTKWILVLTIPLVLTLLMFSNSLMDIFGSDFRAGSTVLAIGAIGQLLNCAVGSVGYLLLMSGHQTMLVRIQAGSALLMVMLMLFLVPRYGLAGAAIGTAAGVAITNAWSLLAVRRMLGMVPYTASYLKLIIPTLGAGIGLLMLARVCAGLFSNWEILTIALLTSYLLFSAAFLATGLDSEDRVFLRSAWDKLHMRQNVWSYE